MNHIKTTCKYLIMLIASCSVLYSCGGGGGGTGNEVKATADLNIFPVDARAPGGVVLLQGKGFDRDCRIRLYMGSNTLADVLSDKDGAVSVQVVIPERTAKGSHTITARPVDGSRCNEAINEASAKIAVSDPRPVITLDQFESRPGSAVEIAGRGFCSAKDCSTVSVLINGFNSADPVSVAADGTFTTDALVPAVEAAGEIIVVALQTDATGKELRAFGDIVVTVKPNRVGGPK